MAVRGVTISRDTEQPGAVQVQFDMVTYFADRGEETPRPAAGAATVPAGRTG